MARKDCRLKPGVYEAKLAELHFERVKIQYWIKDSGQNRAVIFENRDAPVGKRSLTSACN